MVPHLNTLNLITSAKHPVPTCLRDQGIRIWTSLRAVIQLATGSIDFPANTRKLVCEMHRGVQTKAFIHRLNEPWLPPGMLTASPAGPASQLAG